MNTRKTVPFSELRNLVSRSVTIPTKIDSRLAAQLAMAVPHATFSGIMRVNASEATICAFAAANGFRVDSYIKANPSIATFHNASAQAIDALVKNADVVRIEGSAPIYPEKA